MTRTRAFIRGLRRGASLSFTSRPRAPYRHCNDSDALRADWERVGDDLRSAMRGEETRQREPGETWSKDGKTFLCCGFGLPSPTCECNGCKWEYGKLDAPSLEEAMRDRSETRKEARWKRRLPTSSGR
jgi:hypothetical protein